MSDMDMQYLKIGDLCNVTSSKRVFARQYVDVGIPFYRQKEIIDKKNNVVLEAPIFIAESVYNEFEEKFGVPQKDDLLITAVGATLGIPYVVGDEKFYFKDGNLIWLSGFKKELNSTFLYYWIDSSFGTQTLWNRTIGSAQPALTIDSIKKLSIPIPDRNVQDRIVTALKTYDELIEKNNKRINTLEQMAENLYKEWFVRFRFPGYENAEFENGIPKVWKKDRIFAFYETTSGGTPSRSNAEYYENGTIPWLKTGELNDSIIIDTEEYITEEAVKKSSAKILPANVIVMAMYAGGNVGKLGYLDIEMTCSQACCVFKDKRPFSSRHYLFQYLMSIRDYLQSISFGAAQQNISQDLIKKVRIAMPDDETVKCFEEHIQVLHEQTRLLINQNKNLTKQRDLLLPRLMSGKLEV